MCFNGWKVKQPVVSPCHRALLGNKKDRAIDACWI